MLKQTKKFLVSKDKFTELSWLELKDAYWSMTTYAFPFNKLRDLKWWFLHRTTHKHHVVDSRLKPGYYDSDWLMLNANFAILCDFIEKELPWTCFDEIQKIPWWYPDKWYVKKHAQRLAFEHLEWKMKATVKQTCDGENIPISGYQVDVEGTWGWASKEMKELYLWWKYERPKEHTYTGPQWFDKQEDLDEKDDKQLERLIKVRGFMWT